VTENREARSIPIEWLTENPKNFFKPASQEELDSLADSIRELGVIHPLVVRELGDGRYEIVSGHRRRQAAEAAGLKDVPCIIVEADESTAELMLIDANIETRALSTMEMAKAVRRKKELLGIRNGGRVHSATMAELADGLQISERCAYRLDTLNDLIPELQGLVDHGKLGIVAGNRLSKLPPDVQKALFDALGEEIASLSNEEVKRLKEEARRAREESDRGYLVLEVMQRQLRDLEGQLQECQKIIVDRDKMLDEIRKLSHKKEELEQAVYNRESALNHIEGKAKKKGVLPLETVEAIAKPLLALKPYIEQLLEEEAIGEGLEDLLIKYAQAFSEVGEAIESKARVVKDARRRPTERGIRLVK
jgi:ParB family chromosome partitioning protein